jgi:hypothetical protein
MPPSSGSKCAEWESVYVYVGLCFEKKMYGRRMVVGAQAGQIGIADWENCMGKEAALLRAME